jgi:hypothetical protein
MKVERPLLLAEALSEAGWNNAVLNNNGVDPVWWEHPGIGASNVTWMSDPYGN